MMALYRSPDYQTSFETNWLSIQEKFNVDFQRFKLFLSRNLNISNEVSSQLAFR